MQTDIIGDNLIIPINYLDKEKLIIDTLKLREDFENMIFELEEEDF